MARRLTVIEIRDACLRDASFVAANMRRQDVAEIGAVVDVSNRAGIAATLLMASGFDNPNPNLRWAKIAYIKGQPVAVFGFASAAPHIVSGWAYGTQRMARAIPEISRYSLKFLAPRMIAAGVRRAEVRSHVDHDLSHKWLISVGAALETPEPFEYGREGQLFLRYAWTRRTWRARTVWGLAWAARLKR